jgi:hypothetical protein
VNSVPDGKTGPYKYGDMDFQVGESLESETVKYGRESAGLGPQESLG